MASLVKQIMGKCQVDEASGKFIITDKNAINDIILEASQRVERPKRAPNAFIIFKSKLNIDKSEVTGRGTLAKVAKERWDNLSISERDEFTREYEELKELHSRELNSYNEFFSISPEQLSKNQTKAKKTNPDGTPRKRGRPRKNKDNLEHTGENDTGTKVFRYKGNDYLWNPENDEVYNTDGEHIGYKTANGFTEI